MGSLIKMLQRFFGVCGHEWEWGPHLLEFGHEYYQRAMCRRCGKMKQHSIGMAANLNKHSEEKNTHRNKQRATQ